MKVYFINNYYLYLFYFLLHQLNMILVLRTGFEPATYGSSCASMRNKVWITQDGFVKILLNVSKICK